MTYRPRRANARWLEGAPEYVLSCHDNRGKTADRYTVFFGGSQAHIPVPGEPAYACTNAGNTPISYLSMSEAPSHPQGVGISDTLFGYQRAAYMMRSDARKIRWLDLPEKVRKCVTDFAEMDIETT